MRTRRQWLAGAGAAPFAAALAVSTNARAQAAPVHRFVPPVEAPPLALATREGTPRTLADLAGRPVLVAFWATWCAPCRVELPELVRLKDEVDPANLAILAVNFGEPPEKAAGFLDAIGAGALDLLVDPERVTASPWRIGGLPLAYGINPDGEIAFAVIGAADWSSVALRNLLAELAPRRGGAGAGKT